MAGWSDIMNDLDSPQRLNTLRKGYLQELKAHTGRNVIVYFSAWQQQRVPDGNYSIDDNDLNGFMSSIKGMTKTEGLDLILHTPGGEMGATQKIVEYLKSIFDNDIRVFIPHTAMSAGTMIACAAKEIYMGKHSFLGPIDPQVAGIPAQELLNTLDNMKNDLANDQNVRYWQLNLPALPPQIEGVVKNAITHSKRMVLEWLTDNMLEGRDADAETTVEFLSSYDIHMQHNNCLNVKTLNENTKLSIVELEIDEELQDKILSIYHSYQILMTKTHTMKLIENHNLEAFVVSY